MKEVLRMCIVCRQHKEKGCMIRVVKSPSGKISVDEKGKASGRGAYVCSEACLQRCLKSKLLNRAFKSEVPTDVYESLKELPQKENGI